jgi:hypothetical protein
VRREETVGVEVKGVARMRGSTTFCGWVWVVMKLTCLAGDAGAAVKTVESDVSGGDSGGQAAVGDSIAEVLVTGVMKEMVEGFCGVAAVSINGRERAGRGRGIGETRHEGRRRYRGNGVIDKGGVRVVVAKRGGYGRRLFWRGRGC